MYLCASQRSANDRRSSALNTALHTPRCKPVPIQVLQSFASLAGSYICGADSTWVSADIVLEHPSSSRLHAVLQFNGDTKASFLYDANSAHGAFLNRRRIKPGVHVPLRWATC